MLDMAILGLLEERDLHGYEIRRQLRDHLGLLANVSFGSIYPALTRLEKSGAVVATDGGTGSDPLSKAAAPPFQERQPCLRCEVPGKGEAQREAASVVRRAAVGEELGEELPAGGSDAVHLLSPPGAGPR